VLGYLAAGILIGQPLGWWGQKQGPFSIFAEFGVADDVVFLIGRAEPAPCGTCGIELLGLGGICRVVLSAAALMGIAMAYDQPLGVAIRDWLDAVVVIDCDFVAANLSGKGL